MNAARLALVHASPAAITPLANYYAAHEPGWSIVNLLDDGIMRSFRENDQQAVESGLLSLIERAVARYRAQAALVTCSATTLTLMDRLQQASPVPVVKIDLPMAQAAVHAGHRIGVLVTFPPTVEPTRQLLEDVALRTRHHVRVTVELRSDALGALLKGDSATHDRILREAAHALTEAGAEVIVLAQVSMAHLREPLQTELRLPVFSSLETSHAALREILARQSPPAPPASFA